MTASSAVKYRMNILSLLHCHDYCGTAEKARDDRVDEFGKCGAVEIGGEGAAAAGGDVENYVEDAVSCAVDSVLCSDEGLMNGTDSIDKFPDPPRFAADRARATTATTATRTP